MQNSKIKKLLTVALAVTMVMGSTITAFADDNEGSTEGTGSVEGHVEKEVTEVLLPTVDAGSSPFAYIIDPERLIQETDAKKYEEGTVFPDKDTDTGVYFLVGDNEYDNTSSVLQAVNMSSCNVKLTVTVKATTAETDIDLAASASVSEDDPELYLALKVGNDTEVVTDDADGVTVEKVIAGQPDNFEVTVDDEDGYVYQAKADAAEPWQAMNISMTGAVSKVAIEGETTAPKIEVTWSWEKAGAGEEADDDAVDYSTTPTTSYAEDIDTVGTDGMATAQVVIVDDAELISVTTDLFEGNMLNYTNSYGAFYNTETHILYFYGDMTSFLRSNPGTTFTLTFKPAQGENYTFTLKCGN